MQTITEGVSLYFAGKDEEIKYTAQVDSPENVPVRINIIIKLWDGATEIKRSLIPVVDNTSYSAEFDINRVLYGELFKLSQSSAFSTLANAEQPLVERDESMLVKFSIDESYTYENTDGDLEDVIYQEASEDYYAIQGGLGNAMRYHLQANEIDNYINWFNEDDQALKFLSWIPNKMPVHPKQPLRLWFYNDGLLDVSTLYMQATYTDGTESEEIECYDMEGSVALIEIACGVEELEIADIDRDKTVASYKVWLQNSDGSIKTEEKTFVIDYTNYERNDILFFRNSLGVNEVLWCHGRHKEILKTSGEERSHPKASAALEVGTRRQYRSQSNYSWEMNTGFFPKSMRHYLADALSAGEAKFPINGYYMPVLIQPDTFNWGEDGVDLFPVPFTMELAFNEHYYSPMPEALNLQTLAGAFNLDFNFDLF